MSKLWQCMSLTEKNWISIFEFPIFWYCRIHELRGGCDCGSAAISAGVRQLNKPRVQRRFTQRHWLHSLYLCCILKAQTPRFVRPNLAREKYNTKPQSAKPNLMISAAKNTCWSTTVVLSLTFPCLNFWWTSQKLLVTFWPFQSHVGTTTQCCLGCFLTVTSWERFLESRVQRSAGSVDSTKAVPRPQTFCDWLMKRCCAFSVYFPLSRRSSGWQLITANQRAGRHWSLTFVSFNCPRDAATLTWRDVDEIFIRLFSGTKERICWAERTLHVGSPELNFAFLSILLPTQVIALGLGDPKGLRFPKDWGSHAAIPENREMKKKNEIQFFFHQRHALLMTFDIFVVTFRVTNFFAKTGQYAVIFCRKKLNFCFFWIPLFWGFAIPCLYCM